MSSLFNFQGQKKRYLCSMTLSLPKDACAFWSMIGASAYWHCKTLFGMVAPGLFTLLKHPEGAGKL